MDNSIQRNITKEIMKECAAKKASVNENFVIYFVKLLLLDPNWGITSDFVSSRDNVDSFINQVIAEMEAQQFPKIITLQMQFYFTCNMELMTTAVKRNRKDIFDHLVRLQNDIVKTEEVGPEEITKYTRKIICYITLLSGLGNPTMNTVFTEALKAFNSVMDETELMEFVQSTKGDKEEQLQQLVKVVTGIRLFNKDCQKGGEGIEDIPYLLRNALKFFTQELQDTLLTIMEKVNLLTTIVDKCYVVQQTEEGLKMVCTLTPEFAEVYMENVKDLLILYRQFELFVRKILEDMEKMSDHLKLVFCRFDDALRKIHLTVYMRIAIPANIIFPLFEALSDVWTEMQDQVLLLAKNSQILANLHSFSKYTYYNRELFESIVQDDCAYTDAERLEETANLIIESDNNEVEIYSVDDFPDIDKIQLEYLGFCCWKMIETEGGLVPGNPSMGVARYDDKNYVFSTPEACVQFSKNPKEQVMKVLELARRKPQLINFLGIKDQMQEFVDVKRLTEKRVIKKVKNKEVQCLEFSEILPSNIDRTYKWNIWDLKREAILLANLSKCKTVATQTWKTPSRNTIKSQTYQMRDKDVQTKQDNYSNVPKPSNFIYGLRGRKDNQQCIIDLTRPVKE